MERALYIAAALALLAPFLARVWRRAPRVLDHLALPLAAMAFEVAALGIGWAREGHLPLDAFAHGLGALSLWVTVGWLYVRRRPRMEWLGAALLGLAILLVVVGQLAPDPTARPDTDLRTLWFPLHVLLMLVGFLGFALSCAISILYLVVRRRLKARRLAGIARLPSLDTLDRLNLQAMALGFVALTAGMVVGGLWGATREAGRAGPDLTTWATVAVWAWYAAGLHVRLVAGWRGRLAAIFGAVGFGLLALLLGLAMLILRGWHAYGG